MSFGRVQIKLLIVVAAVIVIKLSVLGDIEKARSNKNLVDMG